MTSYADIPASPGTLLGRAEAWLDRRGRGAWIAAMVVGFIVFWPIGLVLLAYMLFARKFNMGGSCNGRPRFMNRGSSGNSAFDSYRNETLRRLEDEQAAFEKFLKRLREAKDKAEFDQFMDDRTKSRDETPADA